MTQTDKDKLAILRHTFDLNYRVTRLYSTYLERFPDFLTPKIVEEICDGGKLTKKDAIVALLTVGFGLDENKSEDDKRIAREYIYPSVRIFDAKKYTENPYYKNIKIDNARCGSFELKKECYPAYRAVIAGDILIRDDFSEVPPLGYFTEDFFFPAVLEDGNEWMTLTPVDMDTSEDAIKKARGKVVTFGLGLGYYTYMVSEKDDVESITVVERSEDVIRLFKEHILPKFKNKDKVNIVQCDAFQYAKEVMPKENFDFAFVDIWRDASDGTPLYLKMRGLENLSPKTEFSYWIENFLISHVRSQVFEALYEMCEKGHPEAPATYEEFVLRLCNVG